MTCRWPRCLIRDLRRSGTRQPAQPVIASAPSTTYPKASSSNSIAAAPAAPAMAAARVASAPATAPAIGSAIAAAEAAAALADEDDDENENGDAEDRKTGAAGRITSAALRHLAPVSKAQAAPAVHVASVAEDGWSIQLGAFRDQSTARQALRRVAGSGS